MAQERIDQNAMLSAHNNTRSAVGVGGLSWSDDLEQIAWNYAKTIQAHHNPNRNNSGENLFSTSSSPDVPKLTAAIAVNDWNQEKKYS